MSIRRKLVGAVTATVASAAASGYYYRPIGDNDLDNTSGPKRNSTFMSKDSLCDRADVPPPLLYSFASSIVVLATASVTRMFMYLGGKFKVKEDSNYVNFVNRVKSRGKGVPLLTVRNDMWRNDSLFCDTSHLKFQIFVY